jgi:hypothetical protein
MTTALIRCYGPENDVGQANFWRQSAAFWAGQIATWRGIIRLHEEAAMNADSCQRELERARESLTFARLRTAEYEAIVLGL